MAPVDQTNRKAPQQAAMTEAADYLLRNAVECTYYVGDGKMLKADLIVEHGLSVAEAEYVLAVAVDELVRHIKEFKAPEE